MPGSGRADAKLLICAEAPGEQESNPTYYEQDYGVPLVGPAGELLQLLLAEAGWSSKEHPTYVTNVVKHRPPLNRTPTLEEQLACQDFLKQEITTIQPQIILGLGRVASDTLCRLANKERLGIFASQQFYLQNTLVLTTYHPSYILRNPAKRNILFEDISWAITTLERL